MKKKKIVNEPFCSQSPSMYMDRREIRKWHSKKIFPFLSLEKAVKEKTSNSWPLDMGIVNVPPIPLYVCVCVSELARWVLR